MIQRVGELCIITLWLVSMSLLVVRDVVPRWYAQSPPRTATVRWLEVHGMDFQYGIYGESRVRRGWCWSRYHVSDDGAITRRETLFLDELPLIGSILLESELTFLNETELDMVDITLKGAQAPIALKGERQGPQFAFQIRIGRVPAKEFILDADAAQTLSDTIRPFSAMRGLEIGQSWIIHTVDPFSLIDSGQRSKLKAVLVTVARMESISIQGRERDCFVVESDLARAWVDRDGRVWRQEVQIPGLGMLEITEEPFQVEKLEQVRKAFNARRNGF